jgi:hypothetical protein
VKPQPLAGTQPSAVQGLPSSHARGSLTQIPATQRSFRVHALASAQSAFVVQQPGVAWFVHPLWMLQPSTVHALPSLQDSGAPDVQVPP